MSEYAIVTHGLTKKYGHFTAVDHVDMHIPVGSIYGFVGENGSGKTTIMRLLMGLARPSEGEYQLFDVNNKDRKIYDVRQQISAIVEAPSLVPTMTARDNLKFACMYYGVRDFKVIDEILQLVGLKDTGKKKVKNFSLGMRQRLGIAVLLLNKPQLLLLDEPMNGLDPQGIADLREIIINLNKQGITILISSHILSELEKVATYWGFINHGNLIQEISADDLLKSCQKSIEIYHHDGEKLEKALKDLGFKRLENVGNNHFRIYDEGVKVTDLLISLRKSGLEIESVRTIDINIEDYYLSLVARGGVNNG